MTEFCLLKLESDNIPSRVFYTFFDGSHVSSTFGSMLGPSGTTTYDGVTPRVRGKGLGLGASEFQG